MRLLWVPLIVAAVLAGCSSTEKWSSDPRYTMKQDKAPSNPPDVSNVPDAVPVALDYSRGGNRPSYEVWGKTYRVMNSHVGYREEGVASWYGLKFHGHKTANGEIYDIYKMSAAHKSLPIPSFARVTNLDNGKSVIVRVNDRGPFHNNRLIDLSYAAASRLDMLKRGTARVRVEAIDAGSASGQAAAPASEVQKVPVVETGVRSAQYLQAGAFGNRDNAEALRSKLEQISGAPVSVLEVQRAGKRLHRVVVGPLTAGISINGIVDRIVSAGYAAPILLDSL